MLAKSGWYGGDPDAVKDAPVDTVMQIVQYEKFEKETEFAYKTLNAPEGFKG